jgi:hypothetical protein
MSKITVVKQTPEELATQEKLIEYFGADAWNKMSKETQDWNIWMYQRTDSQLEKYMKNKQIIEEIADGFSAVFQVNSITSGKGTRTIILHAFALGYKTRLDEEGIGIPTDEELGGLA